MSMDHFGMAKSTVNSTVTYFKPQSSKFQCMLCFQVTDTSFTDTLGPSDTSFMDTLGPSSFLNHTLKPSSMTLGLCDNGKSYVLIVFFKLSR